MKIMTVPWIKIVLLLLNISGILLLDCDRESCPLALKTKPRHTCFCDTFCTYNKDCCGNYDKKPELENWEFDKSKLECTSPWQDNQKPEVEPPTNRLWIKECPDRYTDNQIRQECASTSDETVFNWPVSSINTGTLYKNVFCAMCWNDTKDYVYWKVDVLCEIKKIPGINSVNDFMSIIDTKCIKRYISPFDQPEMNIRECNLKGVVETCPSRASTTAAEMCKNSATQFTMGEDKIYRNHFCASCHRVREWNQLCYYTPVPGFDKYGINNYPLSVIFDFGKETVNMDSRGEDIKSKLSSKCLWNELYDFIAQKCVKLPDSLAQKDSTGNSSFSTCKKTLFYNSDKIKIENGALYIPELELKFDDGNWQTYNNGSIVCIERGVFYDNVDLSPTTEAASIITIVGLSISLVSLAALLIIYLILPWLRKIPGLSIMSLSAALFIAELLFLTGLGPIESPKGLCTAIGVIMHYFFLAAFFWMNSMALDLTLTFAAKGTALNENKYKRFVKFSIYSWGCPAIIVLLSGVLDLLKDKVSPYNPDYGRVMCWINNKHGLGLVFLLPIALLLLANIILFIICVIGIYKAAKASKMIRKNKKNKTSLLLYIKLSLLMGCSWILAFVYVLSQNVIAQFIFIIFNSIQGLLIFISFVCRTKIFKGLRSKVIPSYTEVSSRDTRSTNLVSSSGGNSSPARNRYTDKKSTKKNINSATESTKM